MPLILLVVISHAAGLLFGLGGVVVPAVVIAIVAGAVAAWRKDVRVAALAALLAAGALRGAAARADDRRCTRALRQARTLAVTLLEDGRARGATPARVATGDCERGASVVIVEGAGRAGDRATVRGVAAVGERSVLVRDATLGQRFGFDAFAAARAAAGRAIDRRFADDAALARALVIADMRGVSPEVRDRFARAGLVHILSVSGLHVGIVALAVELLLVAARLPRRAATLLALAAVGAYVLFLGAPPPALRAGVMLAGDRTSRLLQRPTSPWALLALGAGGPLLLDARAVADIGWQLSVAGVAALAAGGALCRRTRVRELRGWRGRVARELVVSTCATLVTAPLVAAAIGQLSVVAPVVNLAATPIVELLQPALFLALVLGVVPPLAALVADAAHALLWVLDLVARAGAWPSWAAIVVSPGPAVALLLGTASVGAVVACASAHAARAAIVPAGALAAAICSPLLPGATRADVELIALDVGQGDAVLLRTPRGRWILFDAGGAWRGGDAGRRAVLPYLRRRGGELAAFVLSHPHTDHVGGAASVIAALRPREFWDAGYVAGGGAYRGALEAARRGGTRWRRVHPRDSIAMDGVVVRFLAPDSVWTAGLTDPNLASTIAQVRYGTVRFLLTGDAEAPEERWLVAHATDLRSDVLKVGHHGSRTSSSAALLDAVRPLAGLVSVGAGNTYGHPSPEIVDAYAARGIALLRTDELGTVTARTDGRRVMLEADGVRWEARPAP